MMRNVLIFVFLVICACSEVLEKKDVSSAESVPTDHSCLGDFVFVQYDFLMNRASHQSATENAECTRQSFLLATRILKGSTHSDFYTVDEIEKFLNNLFFSEDPLNRKMIGHAVVHKSWFIGGQMDGVRTSEMERFADLLVEWKIFLDGMKPLIETLHWRRGVGVDAAFELSYVQAKDHLRKMVRNLPQTIYTFDIEEVRGFISELGEYRGQTDLVEYVDLFHAMVLIINDNDQVIDVEKTFMGFFEFLHQYKVLSRQKDVNIGSLLTSPIAYTQWLDETLEKVNPEGGGITGVPSESLTLIFGFLWGQIF